ncbi:hormone-sensitive lipase [Harmonia axyridis]|uniref:hormone-sensitive lipase n=1 Tax=Harmonia axyridis TaxID=115357 RepID=UPI001E275A41|nr:hormone-sensitive lipase [Harmonia axyridis]
MTETKTCDVVRNVNITISDQEENIEILIVSCRNNSEFFSSDNSESGQRLHISFLAILDYLDSLKPKVQRIQNAMHKFDFDKNVQGNGYRSFISIVGYALKHTNDLSERILNKRDSMLFRKAALTKDIESCSHLLASLDTCFTHLETMMSWSEEGNLFPSEERSPDELISYADSINRYCFYGRNVGFQYCDSLKNIMKFIVLSMAIFSEAYYSQGSFISKATNSFFSTTKFISDPELVAKRVVNISTKADVEFCKAFWFLSESEIMNQIPSFISSSVAVSKTINLPAEPLFINVGDKEIEVPIPSSYIGKRSVQVRLISHSVHDGMMGESKNKAKPASPGLLIHCHGGGFVAQSSKSHECYLRDWAKHLKIPILSIDYSLAPEAPFPRALEEVTYAYCWALKNHSSLGSTGEKIIAAGDSAGANLLVATSLKCITLGLPPPNGLFLAYIPTLVNFVPSPSRLLSMMDPLLPLGFLLRCLKAYAMPDPSLLQNKTVNGQANSDTESFEEITESDLQELQARKSPVSDTSDTLTYGSLCSNLNDENEKDMYLTVSDIEKSEKQVSDFLEKYVLESDTDTDATKMIPSEQEISTSVQSNEYSIHSRVITFVSSLRSRISNIIGSPEGTREVPRDNTELFEGPSKFHDDFKFKAEADPFLSPILASDDLLKQLPPVKVLTVELDPCLDDCVMFAKKLKSLNNDVTLDVLKGLPHGFLNFSMLSKEAYEGSIICVQRIKQLFNFPSDD